MVAILKEPTSLPRKALRIFPLLDASLGMLPSAWREAVILRRLEGRTREEAAVMAGCGLPELATREQRGMARLVKRLGRRYEGMSMNLIESALAYEARAEIPEGVIARGSLVAMAAGWGIGGTATADMLGLTASSLAAARGALKAMLIQNIKIGVAVCATGAVTAFGARTALDHARQADKPTVKEATAPTIPAAEEQSASSVRALAGTNGWRDGKILFRDDFESGLGKWTVVIRKQRRGRYEALDAPIESVAEIATIGGRRAARIRADAFPGRYVGLTTREPLKALAYAVEYDSLAPGFYVPEHVSGAGTAVHAAQWLRVRSERILTTETDEASGLVETIMTRRRFVDGRLVFEKRSLSSDEPRQLYLTIYSSRGGSRWVDNLVIRKLVKCEREKSKKEAIR